MSGNVRSDRDSNEETPLREIHLYINNNNNQQVQESGQVEQDTIYNIQEFYSGKKMDDSMKILIKLIIDFIILLCVGFPILIFFLIGEPYERGFFCDDESLMHPFHESTVRNWMLYIIGLVVPICLMILIEAIKTRISQSRVQPKQLKICNWDIPETVYNCYKQIGVFGFGAACSQLTTDIAKYSIGRLRPHFFTVCQPVMADGTNCSNPINFGRYIEEFTCLGVGSDARMLKEMRLSFPSGHSSFSAYTMIYCAIYLQCRMNWRGSKLVKHFIQFLLLMMTWYTCLSRISDYKHHWSDVLVGAALGATVAIVTATAVSNLFSERRKRSTPMPRYELGSSNNGIV